LLVLLSGRGEPAPHVLRATCLAQEATARGFLVLGLNDRIYLDSASSQVLDAAIRQAIRTTPTLAARVVVGGFSAGGQLAMAYAETVRRDSTLRPWQIWAVLGVDPPLDLAEHWQRAQHHFTAQDCPVLQAGDARIVKELACAFRALPRKCPPPTTPGRPLYPKIRSAATPSTCAVCIYCEPDLLFWQQYCGALQLADLNAPGAAAFVACLQRQGNRQAQYLQTTGKGFQGKHRMPHS
jgi:pimeloyl-ACP methyl ester carboxylesterase